MPRLGSGSYSIVQLEQMLNKCRSERQKLERQRAKVARRLQRLDSRLNALGGNGSRGGRGGGAAAAGGGGGAARGAGTRVRNEKSLTEMLDGILSKASKPMKVGDIADAVKSGGYRTNSANFRGIVNQTLIKDKRFTSAGRGLYQMK